MKQNQTRNLECVWE